MKTSTMGTILWALSVLATAGLLIEGTTSFWMSPGEEAVKRHTMIGFATLVAFGFGQLWIAFFLLASRRILKKNLSEAATDTGPLALPPTATVAGLTIVVLLAWIANGFYGGAVLRAGGSAAIHGGSFVALALLQVAVLVQQRRALRRNEKVLDAAEAALG